MLKRDHDFEKAKYLYTYRQYTL